MESAICTHRFSILDTFEENFPVVLSGFPFSYFITTLWKAAAGMDDELESSPMEAAVNLDCGMVARWCRVSLLRRWRPAGQCGAAGRGFCGQQRVGEVCPGVAVGGERRVGELRRRCAMGEL